MLKNAKEERCVGGKKREAHACDLLVFDLVESELAQVESLWDWFDAAAGTLPDHQQVWKLCQGDRKKHECNHFKTKKVVHNKCNENMTYIVLLWFHPLKQPIAHGPGLERTNDAKGTLDHSL